jgi:WD40 repeat protein
MSRRGPRAAVLVLLLPALAALAAQPQFWKIEGSRDFLDGELEGLAVDSEGRVRLAPASRLLYDTEAPAIWCLARDAKGAVYAGTGNDGKIFKIEAGKGVVFYDAAELEVHALAFGPDGRLYAGTSPDGKVYAIDAAGKADVFYDPSDKYIWALAFDRQGNLFVATGSDAKVHRVDKQGKGQVVLTSPETHITALAVGAGGEVLAGSAPGGIVYRIDTSLKLSVLHDSAYREVKALAFGANGTAYAAVIDGREREDSARPPTPPLAPPLPAAAAPEGFSAEAVVIAQAPLAAPTPRAAEAPRSGIRGAVLLISPTGEADTLWSSSDEMPFSLVNADDGVLVGTGPRGKLFEIKDDRSWTMLGTFPGEQVTGLLRNGAATSVAVSNPGKVFSLEAGSGAKGSFLSKVKDSETVSAWGRLRFSATAPQGSEVQVQTRAGNTKAPDTTWTDWSAPVPMREGGEIAGGRARFLQVRATLIGKNGVSPVLDSIQSAYLQRNLRPIVLSVTVNPPGEVFQKPIAATGEIEILGLEPGQGVEPRPGASPTPRPPLGFPPFGRRLYQRGIQTFTWRAEDPNGDQLVYDVSYRPVGDTNWRPLRKGLTDAVLAWDTSTVPNGRYVVRVTASDAPSNPENLALTGDKASVPFDVDNTPPTIQATLVQRSPARVRVVVRDDSSLIRKAEYAIDGGRWQEVHPTDGINDSLEETYEIVPHDLSPGTHVLVVRASDLLGNTATARVEVSGPTGR